jgi:hypothetical protein
MYNADFHQFTPKLTASPSSSYGLFAVHGQLAYGSGIFLPIATEAWEWSRNFTISDNEASSGYSSKKNFTLMSTCNGGRPISLFLSGYFAHHLLASMAGGTFSVRMHLA